MRISDWSSDVCSSDLTPAVALTCATREALRMGDEVKKMLQAAGAVLRSDDEALKKETEAADDIVDRLHEAIKLYLTRLNNEELDAPESARCVEIHTFTTNHEHIGDIIDKNLMELASKKIKNPHAFSSEGMAGREHFPGRIVRSEERREGKECVRTRRTR